MSRMDVAQARLAQRVEDTGGEDVTYVCGPTSKYPGAVLTIKATFGRNTPQRQAMTDNRVNWEEEPMDFLIRASLLDIGAGPFVPERGDRIAPLAGSLAGEVYEVTPRDGEPEQRKSGSYGHTLRARTIRVA